MNGPTGSVGADAYGETALRDTLDVLAFAWLARLLGIASEMKSQIEEAEASPRRRRIEHRTSQLPFGSRTLYKIEHYFVLPAVALLVTAAVIALVITIAALGFPGHWVAGFELTVSSVTLVMVFAIQHTQGREQAATQRKLDELIRAVPGSNQSLMMLEEASRKVMLDVEDELREARLGTSDPADT